MRTLRLTAAGLTLALTLSPLALDAQRAMQPNDWHRLTTVSQPAMSPDGRVVAFTVTTVNERENKRHQEVWVVPSAGGDPVRYTAPGYESSSPRFSPDGKYLLFSSQRPGGRAAPGLFGWMRRVVKPRSWRIGPRGRGRAMGRSRCLQRQ